MNEQLRLAFPVLWPAMAMAGAVLLVAWWPRTRKSAAASTPGRKGWAGALAFGLAFAAAFCVVVGGLPKYPIPERWQWLLPMVGFATACGVIAGLVERAPPARWLIGLLSAALVGITFHPLPSIENPLLLRIGVAGATAITWLCVETSARRHLGFSTPLLLSIVFTALSLIILQGGNANISLLAAAVSAALGVACAIALLLPPLTLAGGASHVISATLVAITATAWMYSIGHPVALAIIASTPLIARCAELLVPTDRVWKSFIVRLLAVMIPASVAVGLSVLAARESADGYGP